MVTRFLHEVGKDPSVGVRVQGKGDQRAKAVFLGIRFA